MNEKDRDRIISKIQQLLALQESPNEHEAALAAVKARELLVKYNLEIAEVMVSKADDGVIEDDIPFLTKIKSDWEVKLAGGIACAMFCKLLIGYRTLSFVGRPVDVESAKYTFNNIRLKLQALAQERTAEYTKEYTAKYGMSPRWTSGSSHPKAWRMSWIYGAVRGVILKLKESMEADENDVKAIVLVTDKLIEGYIGKQYPKLGKYEGGGFTYNSKAFGKGENDGYNLGVDPALNSGDSHGELNG